MDWWGYWWLIFPLMGAIGAAATAWERGARHRHERRLAIIKAEGESGAARAPGSDPIARRVTSAADGGEAGTSNGSTRTQLERLFAAHDETTRRWLEYELDVAKLIAFPAMSDGRQPLTAAFLRAKRVADRLRPASTKVRLEAVELAEYRNAVTDYEVAFDVAERDARRIADTSFSTAERKRLKTARQLLSVAIDEAATPAERQVAYRRVREELDGLLSLSDDAIDVLEKKVSLELTSGPWHASAPQPDRPRAGPAGREAPAAPMADPTPMREPGSTRSALPRSDSPIAPGRVIRPKRKR